LKLIKNTIDKGILEISIQGHLRSLLEGIRNIKIVGTIIKREDSWLKSKCILSSMSQYANHMATFCKQSNKLFRSTNFLAWKERIDLTLTENEVMEYVLGEVVLPDKEKT